MLAALKTLHQANPCPGERKNSQAFGENFPTILLRSQTSHKCWRRSLKSRSAWALISSEYSYTGFSVVDDWCAYSNSTAAVAEVLAEDFSVVWWWNFGFATRYDVGGFRVTFGGFGFVSFEWMRVWTTWCFVFDYGNEWKLHLVKGLAPDFPHASWLCSRATRKPVESLFPPHHHRTSIGVHSNSFLCTFKASSWLSAWNGRNGICKKFIRNVSGA